MRKWGRVVLIAAAVMMSLLGGVAGAGAQSAPGAGAVVSLRVMLQGGSAGKGTGGPQVVAWLSPMQPVDAEAMQEKRGESYRIVQKDKEFKPHLVVVPVGATIEFPNLDPFFHNVFSLFNGRRFDLGLYEKGGRRSVRFDREGVSYLFCNIHPEMGAVVLALRTPYYAVADKGGRVEMRGVPRGRYTLHVWAEDVREDALAAATRTVEVTSPTTELGAVSLRVEPSKGVEHKNKFGDDYPSSAGAPYSVP